MDLINGTATVLEMYKYYRNNMFQPTDYNFLIAPPYTTDDKKLLAALMPNYNAGIQQPTTDILLFALGIDNAFTRQYASFEYRTLILDNTAITEESIVNSFRTDFTYYLRKNKTRYTQLVKTFNLSDSDYKFNANMNMTTNSNSSGSNTKGAETDTQEKKVFAFDSTEYQPNEQNTDVQGSRTDNFNNGAITTQVGNNGMPSSSLINMHIELWSGYDYYNTIFNDIARELLYIGD